MRKVGKPVLQNQKNKKVVYGFLFSNIVYFLSSYENYFKSSPLFFIPNNWQILIERLYEVVSKLLFDNINLEGEKYFPFIYEESGEDRVTKSEK